jgi:lipopolysaccharide/colanic/teichoic acid biosynthesis glycosyltransferase
MKRLFDIVMAVIGLLVAAPLMALIAVAIKLDSPGRVIFSQKRLGQHGEVFRIHKFRKFPDDWGNKGSGVTVAGDVRMTRLGRFLERSKFDELPQLWNILKGEMSFVGPRPESLNFAELFTGNLRRVHEFKPGIFGPNQVAYRNESEMYPPDRDPDEFYRNELFPAKARADIEYFDQATLLSDVCWMVKGVWVSLVEAVDWKRLLKQRGRHVGYDVLAIGLAWVIGTFMRFDGVPHAMHWHVFVHGFWVLPLVVVPVMFLNGSYRQPVRHFSLSGTMRIAAASIIGFTLAALLVLWFVYRNASLAVFPIAAVAAFILMTGARLYYREQWRRRKRLRNGNGNGSTQRVAIYGAGRRGGALATLLENGFPEVSVAGFIDDNEHDMRGRNIEGRPVLGSERDLGTIHAMHRLHQVWATFEPSRHKLRRLENWCGDNDVDLVILPRTEPFDKLCREEVEPVVKSRRQRSESPDDTGAWRTDVV